jgi:hypothetical protein
MIKESEKQELTTEQKLSVREMQLQISQTANVIYQLDLQYREADKAKKDSEEKLQKYLDNLKPGEDYDIQNDLVWKKRPEVNKVQ